ncbi:hypothetical protein ANCDUO_21114, partial [Ancylostoma duodenale]
KLDNIADLAAVGKDKEAAHLLVEMKEERKKQEDLIRKQEKIVEELNKHVEEHEKEGKKSAEKKTKRGSEEVKKEKQVGGVESAKVENKRIETRDIKNPKESSKAPDVVNAVKDVKPEKPVETTKNTSESIKTVETDKTKSDVPVAVPENSNISDALTKSTKKSIEHVDPREEKVFVFPPLNNWKILIYLAEAAHEIALPAIWAVPSELGGILTFEF